MQKERGAQAATLSRKSVAWCLGGDDLLDGGRRGLLGLGSWCLADTAAEGCVEIDFLVLGVLDGVGRGAGRDLDLVAGDVVLVLAEEVRLGSGGSDVGVLLREG